jgi:hypothetical protein
MHFEAIFRGEYFSIVAARTILWVDAENGFSRASTNGGTMLT